MVLRSGFQISDIRLEKYNPTLSENTPGLEFVHSRTIEHLSELQGIVSFIAFTIDFKPNITQQWLKVE